MIKNTNDIRQAGNEAIIELLKIEITDLKKKGQSHEACCPFHGEKTPSFKVFPKTGTYKCFGCGQKGDSVSFLIDYKHMDYIQAIEFIAKFTNTPIQYDSSWTKEKAQARATENEKKRILKSTLALAHEIYKKQAKPFNEVGEVIDVDGRTFKRSTVEAFGLTMVGKGFLNTTKEDSSIITIDNLLDCDLVRKNEAGKIYDSLQNRIIFPLHNHLGEIIGMSGRVFKKDEKKSKYPKYVNPSETKLYNKSNYLYGLHQNIKAISKAEKCILVEGYTDVIGLHDGGYDLALASAGTALTQQQAKIIKRYANEVFIMRDGDNAGIEAAKKDIIVLAEEGLNIKIILLPENQDPESWIRSTKPKEVMSTFNNAQDAVIWRLMEDWHKDDVHKQHVTLELAGSILSKYPASIQTGYIKKLTSTKNMGAVTSRLKNAIKKEEDAIIQKGGIQLSPQQANDALEFGIYESKNQYIVSNDTSGKGVIISNFIVEPLFLIVAREEQKRLFRITNNRNKSFVADIDTNIFSNFDRFSQFIEGMGNYLYNEFAKKEHHIKLKKKVYPKMPTCYPIYTLGYHHDGFYTWGNGITTVDGKFHPVNDLGLVGHNDTMYYLPAFSSVQDTIKSDDEENVLEDQQNFCFASQPPAPSMNTWINKMVDVHGDDGLIAVAWLFAALNRSTLFKQMNNTFPHLNLFGPPQTGKSFLAWSLAYMFGGTAKTPYNLASGGTDAALARLFSGVRDGIAWCDEYSNDIDFKVVESLKKAFDGAGREKAKGGYGNSVVRSKINSGLIITGQQQPTKDIALFTRCISISFSKRKRSIEAAKKADELREIEKSGAMTQITSSMMKYRDIVKEDFFEYFDDARTTLREATKNQELTIGDRLISNYAMLLAVYQIIEKQEKLDKTGAKDLYNICYSRLLEQAKHINEQDETAIFWRIVSFLLNKKNPAISHKQDIIVKHYPRISGKDINNKPIQFEYKEPKVLVAISLTRIAEEYRDRHKQSRGKEGLEIEALKHYLKSSDAFICYKRGQKFGKATRPAFIFDMEMLPVHFQETKKALSSLTLDVDEDE